MVDMTAADVVESYSRALSARDFDTARALMADDLRFEGPIDTFDRADDYINAIKGLLSMAKGFEHQATIVQGDDVAVFYRLDTPVAVAPVAEWYRIRGGKIRELRAYFDARPFAPPTHGQGGRS